MRHLKVPLTGTAYFIQHPFYSQKNRPTGIHKSVAVAKGFSIRIPAIVCPAFRSSESILLAPLLRADATMRASQNPTRDASSIRNAVEISAGVVSTHQIA